SRIPAPPSTNGASSRSSTTTTTSSTPSRPSFDVSALPALAAFPEEGLDFGPAQAVQHVLLRDAAFPRDQQAPVGQVDLGNRMRVRVDAEHAAEFKAPPVPAPVEVEPPRIAVDLDRNAVLGAGGEHRLDIDVVAGAAEQLAPGHVSENRRRRMADRGQNPFGLLLLVQLEPAVDARHDEVEAGEDIVRIVERAVDEDVRLDPVEDVKPPAVLPVEPGDLRLLLGDLIEAEPAGVEGGARMVGNAEILVAARERSVGHFFQRVDPVRGDGVGMEDAAEVVLLDQNRQ